MNTSQGVFKKNLIKNYMSKVGGEQSQTLIQDMNKYSKEMKEQEKLKGGLSDSHTLFSIAKRHAKTEDAKKIVEIFDLLKKELEMGIKVEMEHTKDKKKAKEIAMDHLFEDPKYYTKLKKIENKEQIIGKTEKMDKPIGKLTSFSKSENKEATGSGSSGGYVGQVAFADSDFVRNSFKETPSKLKEGIAVGAMGLGTPETGETTEATTSGSVGGYETPAMWAKSTKKKDWGPSRKTQYKGGAFVKVKKKCTRFTYCNQGDINALKISKNESVKEAISNVSKKYNISEDVIKTILEYEYSKTKQ